MMRGLSDDAIRHLQMVADLPDMTQTKYDRIELLGRGGMGTVYVARDRELDRLVALKVIASPAASPALVARLLREARILATLEHPGIVPVYDIGVLPDGRPFYSMKLVRGSRLDEYVTPTVPLSERLQIFERICDAVAFAHAHGAIHRDIKPENVMVGSFGEVLVMDWGVAKLAVDSDEVTAVVGTPGYMAPEQEQGPTGNVDQRADVHALGVLLGGLLNRQTMSRGESLDARNPVPPRQLQAIVEKATGHDPENRYQQVEELVADLARFRAGQAIDAYRENLIERGRRVARKHKLPIALVLAYVLMRIALLVILRA